jgi:hypothetical protein
MGHSINPISNSAGNERLLRDLLAVGLLEEESWRSARRRLQAQVGDGFARELRRSLASSSPYRISPSKAA